MDFSFFLIDNKSGYKTRESWFSKNYPGEYNDIVTYCESLDIDLNFKEKIWFYFHQLKERPKCKTCGKELKFRNRFDEAYGEFCSLNCINSNHDEMTNRQKKTFQKKYGGDFYPQHKDFIKKQKETKLQKYNDQNYNNIEKCKQTKLDKHGNENYNNTDKYKATCLSKYGASNYSLSETYINQINETFKNLYPNINFININKFDVDIQCIGCGKVFNITKQNLYERSKRNYEICTLCNPVGQGNTSGYEKEICDFIKEIGFNISTSNKILPN